MTVSVHPVAALVAKLVHWLLTGVWPATLPATAPSAPTYTLSRGTPGMPAAYTATVAPPASKDAAAVKIMLTYAVTPAGGPAGTPTTVDATGGLPAFDLNPGDAISGFYRTADAAGVLSPESPVGSVTAPVAPAAPTFALANAPAA